jgi:hypothetical protein
MLFPHFTQGPTGWKLRKSTFQEPSAENERLWPLLHEDGCRLPPFR